MNNEILMAYLDGELSPLDRGRVAEHIVGCGACRATVNHLREVAAALSRWTVPEPAALPTAAELLASAGVAPAAPPRPAPLRGAPKWAVAAALALSASAIGIVAVKVAVDSGETQVARAPVTDAEAPPAAATGAAPAEEPAPAPEEPGEPQAAEPQTAAREPAPQADDGTVGRVEAPPAAEPLPETAPGGDAAAQAQAPGSEAVGVTANEEATGVAPPPPPAAPTVAPREEARAERDAEADEAKAGRSLRAAPRAPLAMKQRAASTLIRGARVTLQSREPAALAGRVAQYAQGAGGRVAKRSRIGRDGAVEVTVEVPADQFDRVYAQIKGLAAVRNEVLSNRDAADRLEQIDAELADRREGGEDLSRGRRPTAAQLESERVRLLDQVQRGTITVRIASGE